MKYRRLEMNVKLWKTKEKALRGKVTRIIAKNNITRYNLGGILTMINKESIED